MKIGKTNLDLKDIAQIIDTRDPNCCEEWEIYYKQGGKICFSTKEEGFSNAIGNISSKELEQKILEIINILGI